MSHTLHAFCLVNQPALCKCLRELVSEDDHTEDQLTPQLANAILEDAARERATDNHLAPDHSHGIRVRFRIDGDVVDCVSIAGNVGQRPLNQLKVLGRLDPLATLKPATTRLTHKVDEVEIDLRLTATPKV